MARNRVHARTLCEGNEVGGGEAEAGAGTYAVDVE